MKITPQSTVSGALAGAGLVITMAGNAIAQAETTAPTLWQALTEGDPGVSARYRFELVDQDNFERDAEASTLRTRLNYRTGEWRGLSAFVEFEDVSEIGPDDFNAGAGNTPDRTAFPVVADPSSTELNQAYLDIAPAAGVRLRGGRQQIKLDNDRFVGNVGWRQNEQTFDGVSLRYDVTGDLRVFYGYIANVNRIFSDDVPAGNHDNDTHLVNIGYTLLPQHKLTGYFYNIDNEDVPGLSNRSAGLRYTGNFELGANAQLELLGEYARQNDAAANPVDYTADYWRGEVGVSARPWARIGGGVEILSGDNDIGGAFRTPLATLHAFNGWADQFLSTPDAGLEDWFISVSGKHQRLSWKAVWHRFEAETGSTEFGSEFDASLGVRVYRDLSLLVKAAVFDADAPGFTDVTKFWTMLSASF